MENKISFENLKNNLLYEYKISFHNNDNTFPSENLKSYALNLQQLCDTINKVTSHFAKSSSYIKTIFSDLKYQTYLTSVMDSMNRGNKSFI